MEYNATTKLLYWRWIGLYLNYNYKLDDAETAYDQKDDEIREQLKQTGKPDDIDEYNKLLAADVDRWMTELAQETGCTRAELELDAATNAAAFYRI